MYIFESVNQPVSDASAHAKVVSRAGRLWGPFGYWMGGWNQMTPILPQSEIPGFQMLLIQGKHCALETGRFGFKSSPFATAKLSNPGPL